jgi:hypothetical protein
MPDGDHSKIERLPRTDGDEGTWRRRHGPWSVLSVGPHKFSRSASRSASPRGLKFSRSASRRRVFALFPDLRGEVKGATVGEGVLRIEAELTATLGGRPFTWTVRDRFTFAGEKVVARITAFNPAPLMLAIVMRPSAWGVWWRSGVGPPRRRVRA